MKYAITLKRQVEFLFKDTLDKFDEVKSSVTHEDMLFLQNYIPANTRTSKTDRGLEGVSWSPKSFSEAGLVGS